MSACYHALRPKLWPYKNLKIHNRSNRIFPNILWVTYEIRTLGGNTVNNYNIIKLNVILLIFGGMNIESNENRVINSFIEAFKYNILLAVKQHILYHRPHDDFKLKTLFWILVLQQSYSPVYFAMGTKHRKCPFTDHITVSICLYHWHVSTNLFIIDRLFIFNNVMYSVITCLDNCLAIFFFYFTDILFEKIRGRMIHLPSP